MQLPAGVVPADATPAALINANVKAIFLNTFASSY
jgi:hypothetical protein